MATRASTFSRGTLRKRIGELQCLYGIASVAAMPGATLEEQASRIVELLPGAFRDHRRAFARITHGGREYVSGTPFPDAFILSADITDDGERVGSVEIGYRDAPAEPDICGPEALLLNAVAERLGGIVERRRSRDQLQTMKRKAVEFKALDRMKTNLLATVSHELRTPLTTIKGYTTMMLDYHAKLAPEEIRDCLEAVDAATDRLRRLVDNLLETSRLEAGMLKLDKRPGDLRELVEGVAAEARLRSARHDIAARVAADARKVEMDERRIRQVLDNLVENAIKYSPDGGTIQIATRRSDGGVEVSVSDEGPGIPPQELAHVFKRMYRLARAPRKPGADGLGLGLSICQRIVKAHGGTIRAANRETGGAVITFTLPCRADGRKKPRRAKEAGA